MSDIFISYASQDRSRAEPLAKALEEQGWSVWWDRTIPPGKTFDQVIEEAIKAARCVVVLWSKISIKSDWVKEEANIGKERKILVPARIDPVDLPLGFGRIQAADLTNWEAETSHPGFLSLRNAISDIVRPQQQKEKGEQVAEIPESDLEKRLEVQPEESETPQPIPRQPEPTKVKRPEPKPDATAPIKSKSSEPRKTSNALKFGLLAGVAVLLIAGVWWAFSQQQVKEVRQNIEKLNTQTLNLENAVAEIDKPEQIKELYKQRDTLSQTADALSEQATEFNLESQLEELQNRLKQIQIQLANKEKKLIAARKGKIFVKSLPENAIVEISEIDQPFQQGMGLEPGKYHVKVSSRGYESQDRLIELGPGEEERINFKLKKIAPIRFELAKEKVITNSIGMKFVHIPAGNFMMGSKLSPKETEKNYGGATWWLENEHPQHKVTISKQFYLQSTEVTQGQWKRVMGDNPSHFKRCGDDCPVENVSWNDAQKFIKKLNEMEGTDRYRFPTEAEWEHACRSGSATVFSFGDDDSQLGEYAWYSENAKSRTHAVGKNNPNAWKLYDMHGNVWEWVEDDWYDNYRGAPTDQKAWVDKPRGKHRAFRSSSYDASSNDCRSAQRNYAQPVERRKNLGFRLASSSFPKTYTNSIGMKFVHIPAGNFMMGSKVSPEQIAQKYGVDEGKHFKGEHPLHSVEINKPFYIQTTEVTQGQWKSVMGNNPAYYQDCGDDCPVESVSWDKVQEFISRLNERAVAHKYRLPTEAEWEYACRTGTATSYYTGDSIDDLKRAGWYRENSGEQTHSVGAKTENKFGIYDMHGNVWEWVEDDWHETYDGAPADGSAWVDKKRRDYRVIRGCSYRNPAQSCRSVFRYKNASNVRDQWVGFRLASSGPLGP